MPELDKIDVIKELLCVKHKLASMSLFGLSKINFSINSLCVDQLTSDICILLTTDAFYVQFHNKYIIVVT